MTQPKGAAQTAARDRLDAERLAAEVPYGYSAVWWRRKAIELQERLDAASRFSRSEREQAAPTPDLGFHLERENETAPYYIVVPALKAENYAERRVMADDFHVALWRQLRGASAVPSPALEKCPQCDSDDRRVNATSEYNCLHTWHKQGVPSHAATPGDATVYLTCGHCQKQTIYDARDVARVLKEAESPVPSPVGSVYEVPADCRPSCTVCASAMIPTGYKCYSCGSQTGFPSESPAPSEAAPEDLTPFADLWREYSNGADYSVETLHFARYAHIRLAANTTTLAPRDSESQSEAGRVKLSGVQDHADKAQIVGGEADQPSEAMSSMRLIKAVKGLLGWVPVCSVGSSGHLLRVEVELALKEFGEDGSLKSVVGVEADLKHPRKDTGGEIAESSREAVSSTAAPEMPHDLLSDLSLEIANEYEFDGDTSLAAIDEGLRKAFKAGAGTAAPEDAISALQDDLREDFRWLQEISYALGRDDTRPDDLESMLKAIAKLKSRALGQPHRRRKS